MSHLLQISDLHVQVEDKAIIKGLSLSVKSGEIHAVMGPNGNGKSTLLQTIMGNPNYTISQGKIVYDEQDLTTMTVDERSKAGLFLAMQYPQTISGVTNSDFLRAAINARREKSIGLYEFIKLIDKNIAKLKMREDLAHRFVNDGFSGGEKKRNEILQMLMLQPNLLMLDEIDSGLDVDAIKIVSEAINDYIKEKDCGILAVSHYERFFTMIKPTHAHVIIDGKIVVEGDSELVEKIDNDGYDWLYHELKLEKKMPSRPLVYSLGVCAHHKGNNNG